MAFTVTIEDSRATLFGFGMNSHSGQDTYDQGYGRGTYVTRRNKRRRRGYPNYRPGFNPQSPQGPRQQRPAPKPSPKPVPNPNPNLGPKLAPGAAGLDAGDMALIAELRKVKGLKSLNGKLNPTICARSKAYAKKMANGVGLNHSDYSSRYGYSEVIAMNGGYKNPAKSCVDGWLASRQGHREAILGSHREYCYAMAKSRNGTTYCIGNFKN